MPANSTSSIPQMSSIPKEKPQNFPDFILIGAGKSGTTAYHKILSQHPGIYCSTPKEPNFFAYPEMSTRTYGASHQHNIKTEAAYRDLFRAADPSQIRGEASVGYFPQLNTPMRIHHSLPRVKLIAILRHPVDRAYSSWLHRRHDFMEPIDDFHEACQAGPARAASAALAGLFPSGSNQNISIRRLAVISAASASRYLQIPRRRFGKSP